jgi:Cytochrome c oxidase subunit III
MTNINRKQFQAFPYHLVDPSPWPLLTSFALFIMAVGAVMFFHGFANGGHLLTLGFLLTASGMILWFRDVVAEGTNFAKLNKNINTSLRPLRPLINIKNAKFMFKTYVTSIIRISIKILLLFKSYKINRYSHTAIENTVSVVTLREQRDLEVTGEREQYKQNPKIYYRDQLVGNLAGLLEGDGHISSLN